MKVMYASDDKYAWLMAISMLSFFENNKESDEVNVFLFGDNLSKNTQIISMAAHSEKLDRRVAA